MSVLIGEARKAKLILRQEGLRALCRQYGWKFFVGVFFYYLIRDLTVYLLIPTIVAKLLVP